MFFVFKRRGYELFPSEEDICEEGTHGKTDWLVLQLNVLKLYI